MVDDASGADKKNTLALVLRQLINPRPDGPLHFPRPVGAGEGTGHLASIAAPRRHNETRKKRSKDRQNHCEDSSVNVQLRPILRLPQVITGQIW